MLFPRNRPQTRDELQAEFDRIDENTQELLEVFRPGDMMPSLCGEYIRKNGRVGWLQCNGQAYSKRKYKKLHQAIGIQHGDANAAGMFKVPDMGQKFLVGAAQNEAVGSPGATIDYDTGASTIRVVWWIKT